jgi:flagellar hook assembly protein FlgD
LINEPKPAGSYSVVWDGKNDIGANVATGVYIYSIEAGKHQQNKKTVFLK